MVNGFLRKLKKSLKKHAFIIGEVVGDKLQKGTDIKLSIG